MSSISATFTVLIYFVYKVIKSEYLRLFVDLEIQGVNFRIVDLTFVVIVYYFVQHYYFKNCQQLMRKYERIDTKIKYAVSLVSFLIVYGALILLVCKVM